MFCQVQVCGVRLGLQFRKEYFFMHKHRNGVVQNELAEELAWAQARPSSKAASHTLPHVASINSSNI